MGMTIFKVPAAALRLLVIACIMLVAMQVTEADRELDHGAEGVLLHRDQVASANTKAALSVFPATACKLLHLPCALQFSGDDDCFPNGQRCLRSEDCCSGMCNFDPIFPGLCEQQCFPNGQRCLRSEDCCSGKCNFDPIFPGICEKQCFPNGQRCLRSEDCCSGMCNFDPIFPGKCEKHKDQV